MKVVAVIAILLAIGAAVNLATGSTFPAIDIGMIVVALILSLAFVPSRDR